MRKYFNILRARRTGNILALSIVLAFGGLSVIRLYPFQNSLNDIVVSVDDWGRYARFALDIKRHGILMPSLKENYWAPAGFLYNYFIALIFYLFGENTIPVFIIQNFLLGFSVTLIYLAFRDQMKNLTSIMFLLTLFLFALMDVYKYYSFRFLSENLALFTISAFFFCFIRGIEKNKLSLQLSAAVLMGLSILVRPNIFPFAVILIAIASFYYLEQQKARTLYFFLFVGFMLLSSSFLALRNYFACGSFEFLPTEGISFGRSLFSGHDFSLAICLNKILFFLGFLSPLNPEYQWRPHWTIMWIGYFIYLFLRFTDDRKFEIWEVTAHLFIFSYYGLLLLIAPQLGSYGFRLLVPALFIVLPFSFMTLDKLRKEPVLA